MLEKLMIKAIKEFSKKHPQNTIRNVYAFDWYKNNATFNIEYVDENCNYKEEPIEVTI